MNKIPSELTTIGSGSYEAADVHFLLRAMHIAPTDVAEKERLIQTNQRHYSEMIGVETAPSESHKSLFEAALSKNGCRMAGEIQSLALTIKSMYAGPTIALVSFVRAGLPLGVLLRRALIDLGVDAHHYGVSIVRDRGIDHIALEAIIAAHGASNILFVDGWTGKGAIADQLECSLNDDERFKDKARLVVLADPCGKATLAASAEDWIIPSGILGATVSGLVSRSIWPDDGGLHGCVVYDHLLGHDVTRSFVDHIDGERKKITREISAAKLWTSEEKSKLQARAKLVVDELAECFKVANINRIKPGIAEATRAVLRRVPDHVLVRRRADSDVQLLMHLTELAGIQVEEAGDVLGPYRAVTIIKGVS